MGWANCHTIQLSPLSKEGRTAAVEWAISGASTTL